MDRWECGEWNQADDLQTQEIPIFQGGFNHVPILFLVAQIIATLGNCI